MENGYDGRIVQPSPLIDLADETDRHVVVAAGTEEVYQGHPTTVLLADNQTMLCVWCINHGGHCGPLARSGDGGLTWRRLETTDDWQRVHNCPSIYLLIDPDGVERLFVFAARADDDATMQQTCSEDGGLTWTPFRSIGPFPCRLLPPSSSSRAAIVWDCIHAVRATATPRL